MEKLDHRDQKVIPVIQVRKGKKATLAIQGRKVQRGKLVRLGRKDLPDRLARKVTLEDITSRLLTIRAT